MKQDSGINIACPSLWMLETDAVDPMPPYVIDPVPVNVW